MAETVVGKVVQTPGKFDHKHQVEAYLDELLKSAAFHRKRCDIIIPGNPEATVREQREGWNRCLMEIGRSFGATEALFKCGWLDEAGWHKAHDKTLTFLSTRVVGFV